MHTENICKTSVKGKVQKYKDANATIFIQIGAIQ